MKPSACLKTLFIIALFALLSASLWSQTGPNGPKYDKGREVKIKGVVEDIKDVAGVGEGMHLIVKSATTTYTVHVGPGGFLKELDVAYAKGDQVEITGCTLPESDTPNEILAKDIVKGNDTFTLRDAKGIPIWSGWRPTK